MGATLMSDADTEIAECIEQHQSFLLDAGAGAGKTHSLVQCLKSLLKAERTRLKASNQQIGCITFTNVAKDEIAQRIDNDPLVRVSTIHDFLWELIAPHQRALRVAIAKYNQSLKEGSRRKVDQAALAAALPHMKIIYADLGTNLMKGRLFHDDLIQVANLMFRDNPLLSRIGAAKYPFLFVDEYQDTSLPVVEIVLGTILPNMKDRFVVGLFGDKLQSIYTSSTNPGIGEIPAAFLSMLRPIIKPDNRRCPTAVIDVLNRIRDDIQQVPADNNVKGEALYLFAQDESGLDDAQTYLRKERGWSITQSETKQLFLTHRLIAKKGGYSDLMQVYGDRGGFFREDFLGGEDRTIAFFMDKAEALATAWRSNKLGRAVSVLKKNSFQLASNEAKREVRTALDKLDQLRLLGTVREVLLHIQQANLFTILEDIEERLKTPKRDTSKMDGKDAEYEERDAKFTQISSTCHISRWLPSSIFS
jgi:DNA helicase-2/ATP-dependent DNA helicase PcrA